ncbi:MAG: N-acetylgalactosamine 6-sulfate sulfatase [Opitutaceae bacterium]|nr:N-acetylgalactosamine 6-sulfate sulfatase [Opitutaceae bacterium]|tara:strand:- start:1963 stop:3342 length:1380 start_codon:yes stop_codon:yes gene_type:complete
MHTLRHYFAGTLGIFCFLSLTQTVIAQNTHPNLLVIMTDDQGFADVGFNGCEDIPTPGLDRIAAEGVRFTNGYVTHPYCSPSRAAFITGRYQGRFGYHRNPTLNPFDDMAGLPLEEENVAEILKKVGYHSGIIGKWHLGTHPKFRPNVRGFHEFYGFVAGGHRYFPEDLTYPDIESVDRRGAWYNTKLLRNETRIETDEYLTDELSHEAVDFIKRNRTKPFFLFLSYNAPHTPMQASQKYLDRFEHIDDPLRRTYAAMMSAIDDGAGRVLDTLDELQLAEKTLVFYLSDNGGARNNGSFNTPLRGYKGDVYDGGIRVPFAFRWTGNIEGGRDFNHLVSSMDILATIVGLTGVEIAEDRPLDGVNLIPYLKDERKGAPHDQLFWVEFDWGNNGVRSGNNKLVHFEDTKKTELYQISNDINESQNLSENNPSETKKMEEALSIWRNQLIDPIFDRLGTWDP